MIFYLKQKIHGAFFFQLEDIGDDIEKIRIGHDDSGFATGWFLAKVEVRKLNSSGMVNILKTISSFNNNVMVSNPNLSPNLKIGKIDSCHGFQK